MKKLSILLIGLFASLNGFAQVYTNDQLYEILKENEALRAENAEYAKLLNEAIASKKETLKLKSILRQAGLIVDLKAESLQLLDSQKFMTACDVVVFDQDEFNALNVEQADAEIVPDDTGVRHIREDDAATERDFRNASKADFQENSKDFWNSVIY